MKLTKRILAVMLACVMALCMLTACGGGGGGNGGGAVSGDMKTAVLNTINSKRKAAGLKEVVEVDRLDEYAELGTVAYFTYDGKNYEPVTGVLFADGVTSSNLSSHKTIVDHACDDFEYIGISVKDGTYSGTYLITILEFKAE